MKLSKIMKAALAAYAVYKANEEEIEPLIAAAKRVVGKKRKA